MRFLIIYILTLAAVSYSAIAEGAVLFLQPGALSFGGIYNIREIDPNLTGKSIKIASVCRSDTYKNGKPIGDFAVDISHRCFADANISFFADPCQIVIPSKHSSAIASILVGTDAGGQFSGLGEFYYEGAVPDAKLDVYEFWHFLKNNAYISNAPQADIITMSLGQASPSWWTRAIEKMSQNGIVIVAGIGNGTDAYDAPLYPAAGMNCIGVGVADCVTDLEPANYLSIFGNVQTAHSSAGPSKEAVCKPDIVSPANCLVPDGNNGYTISGNYSSFATPIVAGAAGLLIEKAKNTPSLSTVFDANNADCVIKAILMNSADKLPYWHKGQPDSNDDNTTALDWAQGAGMLNATAAMDTLTSDEPLKSGWVNQSVFGGKAKSYSIETDSDAEHITATLVWKRYFSDSYPFDIIKNADLRLELWAIDANDPNNKIMVNYSDCANGGVEHIYYYADANYSKYELTVSLSQNTDSNDFQQFALVWEVSIRNDNTDDIMLYDLNNDGLVNHKDFSSVFENIGKNSRTGRQYIYGDLDSNGIIELSDLRKIYGQKDRIADWKHKAENVR